MIHTSSVRQKTVDTLQKRCLVSGKGCAFGAFFFEGAREEGQGASLGSEFDSESRLVPCPLPLVPLPSFSIQNPRDGGRQIRGQGAAEQKRRPKRKSSEQTRHGAPGGMRTVRTEAKQVFAGRQAVRKPQATCARRSTSPALRRARAAPSARMARTRSGSAAYSARRARASAKYRSAASASFVLTMP